MSSLVGHGLAGTLASSVACGPQAFRGRRVMLWLGAAIALVPDFDVVIWMVLRPAGISPHRGFSHSLLFAAMSALVFTVAARLRARLPLRTALFALLGAAISHPLLDFLMGAGPGIRFLAPFSETGYLFALRAVPTAYYGLSAGSLLAVLLAPRTILGVALEVLIFFPLILAAQSRGPRRRGILFAVSVAAWAVSLYLYNWTAVRSDRIARAPDIEPASVALPGSLRQRGYGYQVERARPGRKVAPIGKHREVGPEIAV